MIIILINSKRFLLLLFQGNFLESPKIKTTSIKSKLKALSLLLLLGELGVKINYFKSYKSSTIINRLL